LEGGRYKKVYYLPPFLGGIKLLKRNRKPGLKDLISSSKERRNLKLGLIFISPWIIGFSMFILYPIFASLYYSFTDYTMISAPKWIGLSNYTKLFFRDEYFRISLYNTLYYTLFSVPLDIVFSVAIALLLNTKVEGMSVYRTIYFLPSITPVVAISILWLWLLNPQYGLVNSILRLIGIEGPGWLTDPVWAKPSLIMMSIWGTGRAIVIYLAGLQDIPQELYEAAEIDGASSLEKVRRITLPLLTPSIFFNSIIGMIGAFQTFTQAYIMTGGGPLNSTLFYGLYLYRNAFNYFSMGYASALAWILFVIVFLCSLLVFKSSGRWVHYGQ
jgi:multiple sugar transport system permease protein